MKFWDYPNKFTDQAVGVMCHSAPVHARSRDPCRNMVYGRAEGRPPGGCGGCGAGNRHNGDGTTGRTVIRSAIGWKRRVFVGASGWEYVVPYQSDMTEARAAVRGRVF